MAQESLGDCIELLDGDLKSLGDELTEDDLEWLHDYPWILRSE